MSKIKILWSGITGKTGQKALEVAQNNTQVEIIAGVCRNNNNFYNYDNLNNITDDFDVIVDFSHKDSFDKVLEFALKLKKPLIVGISGLTEKQIDAIKNASNIIPIFRGGNFRFEVKKFIDDIVKYAKEYNEDSLELIETHYKTLSIPSQTAKVIKKRVLDETGKVVNIKSFLQDEEDTNDWRVNDIHYHCDTYDEKLINNIFEIAIMMNKKMPNGVYDLDRLLKEKNNSNYI